MSRKKLTNLGIFSKFAEFSRQNIGILMTSISAAFLLGPISIAAGVLVAWRWTLPDQLASGISLWIMNYILVIVFSAQFLRALVRERVRSLIREIDQVAW